MTSVRKIAANRANSRASTGPKSRKGKSRAAQNARRHGLSLSVLLHPTLSKEVEDLAQEITGGSSDHLVREAARRVAEAQIDLERIYRVRHDYLRRYLGLLDWAAKSASSISSETFGGENRCGLKIPELARRNILEHLVKIDRYEQRARSKRKFAARMLSVSFEAARRRSSTAKSGE